MQSTYNKQFLELGTQRIRHYLFREWAEENMKSNKKYTFSLADAWNQEPKWVLDFLDSWFSDGFYPSTGCGEVLRFLFKNGANINCQDDEGTTPLMKYISRFYYTDMHLIKTMLKIGVCPNIENHKGTTALILAICKKRRGVVQALVRAKAQIDHQDSNGQTALMHAVHTDETEIVTYLLAKKADIHLQDNEGWTALMHASRYGWHYNTLLLVQKGADMDVQDSQGRTALTLASQEGYEKVVNYLLEKGANNNLRDKKDEDMFDRTKEFILMAATLRKEPYEKSLKGVCNYPIDDFHIGYRHSDIFRYSDTRKDFKAQGFVTSTGRWVSREDALILAKTCGQVTSIIGSCLTSEDLYLKQ